MSPLNVALKPFRPSNASQILAPAFGQNTAQHQPNNAFAKQILTPALAAGVGRQLSIMG